MKSRKVLLAILLGGIILSLPMAGAVKKKVKRLPAVQQLLSLEAVRLQKLQDIPI